MKEKKIKAICCASLLFVLALCFSSCDTLSGDIGESSTGEENTIETVLESDEENTSDSVLESGEESTYEIILDEADLSYFYPFGWPEGVVVDALTADLITLEPDKQDLPTYEDLCRIQDGMTIDEVYSIAGNPQRTVIYMIQTYPTSSSSYPQPWKCYIYDSCDGNSILIAWISKRIQESDENSICIETTVHCTYKLSPQKEE